MSGKILASIFLVPLAYASEGNIPGYGFTYEEWYSIGGNVYDNVGNSANPMKEAQKRLAQRWPIPINMLFSPVVYRYPELVLFAVGVAKVNPRYVESNVNALSLLIKRLARPWLNYEFPEKLVKNLVSVGVPLKHAKFPEQEIDCEQMLQNMVTKPEKNPIGVQAQEVLTYIAQAKKEVELAQEHHKKKIHQEIMEAASLGNSLTSLVVDYIEIEHVIPDEVQAKIDLLKQDQKKVQATLARDAQKSTFERLFCCCG